MGSGPQNKLFNFFLTYQASRLLQNVKNSIFVVYLFLETLLKQNIVDSTIGNCLDGYNLNLSGQTGSAFDLLS